MAKIHIGNETDVVMKRFFSIFMVSLLAVTVCGHSAYAAGDVAVTLEKSGLQKGESVIFRFSKLQAGQPVSEFDVLLTGVSGMNTVAKVVHLSEGEWKVEELSWAWTLEAVPSRSISITSSSQPQTITFPGVKKNFAEPILHAEDVVINDFGEQTTVSSVGSGAVNLLQNP